MVLAIERTHEDGDVELEIAEALREILSEITVKIDGKSLADYVSGRIILASGRNAGRSK